MNPGNKSSFCLVLSFLDQTEEIWSVDQNLQGRAYLLTMNLYISGRSVPPSFSTLVRQLSVVHENSTFLLIILFGYRWYSNSYQPGYQRLCGRRCIQ